MISSEPYWWESAGPPQSPPEQPLPADVDVLVIGAGYTGLSASRTLAKHGKAVLCLDAGAPGWAASSRNGGMFGGGHRMSIDQMEAQFGPDIAHRLMREGHLEAGDFARSVMRAENIDCDYQETGRFRGLWRNSEYESSARSLAQLQRLIPVEAEMLPRHRQHEEISSDIYRGGMVFHKHGGLNPAKWVAGLLNAALRAGALVQGNCPVVSVLPDGAGFLVATSRGSVRAGSVLAATNGYTRAALPKLRRRVVPLHSFVVVTEELGRDGIRALLPNGRMIVESRDRHCYYRPSPDGKRLVFGARAAMFDAPERIIQREMRGLMTQVLPQLRSVELTHSWRGRTGFSFNFLPNVGRIDGIWHAMAYSGSGTVMAPWLGHKAALQILGDAEGETAFSETDLPSRWWHPGPAWFLPFADVTFRIKDALNNSFRGT